MEKSFIMEIITPLGLTFKSDVTHVMLPGVEGYFGILAGHEPFITSLKTGKVKVDLSSGEIKYFAVTGGLVEVLPNKVSVLVETAEEAHEIDLERALDAKKRALKKISEEKDKREKEKAAKALERAKVRIHVAEQLKAKK